MTKRSTSATAKTLQHVLLTPLVGIVFFLVLTPIGVVLRRVIDPLQLRWRSDRASYWSAPHGLAQVEETSSAHPRARRNS
ncbi:hypothetical protein [Kutzneria sp. CA-103260]|uniref:hypothetical protein n=1 Tax=Kutzneria sp. CA-103260 TaxID=2802641 RepID=UPI001BAC861A|nr:hypothetical protein [Kutzneria sp. CA-103260]